MCRFSPQCSLTLYRIIHCVHHQSSVSSHTLQNQPLSACPVLTVTSHSTELASVCTSCSLFPNTLQYKPPCTEVYCSLTLYRINVCAHVQSSLFPQAQQNQPLRARSVLLPHTLQNQPLCARSVLSVPSHSIESASLCMSSPHCSLTLYRITLCVQDQSSVSSHTVENKPLCARSVLTFPSHSKESHSVCTFSPHCYLKLYKISLCVQVSVLTVPSHSTK